MKTFKQLRETNTSSGLGIRGFGNVTGDPTIDDDEESQYYTDNQAYTQQLQDNMTNGLYGMMNDEWWMNNKDMKGFTKGKPAGLGFKTSNKSTLEEGMEKDHYKAIDDVHVNLDNRNHAIEDYGYGPLNPNEDSTKFWKEKADLWETSVDEAKKSRCGNCAAFNKSKEITDRIAYNLGPAGKTITEKADLGFCEMFHFKCAAARTCDAWLMNGPITEEMGGVMSSAGGTNVGSGYIAGTGHPLEGKPDNWGEPGVSPKYQGRKKKKEDDPRMFGILRRKVAETDALKEIPIYEVKRGMFAGEQTFVVPESVYERAMHAKQNHKHWRTYINNEEIHPAIREFANSNPNSPIIFENEKTGYMCYARYGKKRKR